MYVQSNTVNPSLWLWRSSLFCPAITVNLQLCYVVYQVLPYCARTPQIQAASRCPPCGPCAPYAGFEGNGGYAVQRLQRCYLGYRLKPQQRKRWVRWYLWGGVKQKFTATKNEFIEWLILKKQPLTEEWVVLAFLFDCLISCRRTVMRVTTGSLTNTHTSLHFYFYGEVHRHNTWVKVSYL